MNTTPEATKKQAPFEVMPASEVVKKPVNWLWRGFIRRGLVGGLTGAPGAGKTTIACDLAAAFSTERPLPGDTDADLKARGKLRTWFITAEDSNSDLRWKLENQDADLGQISVTDEAVSFLEKEHVAEFAKRVKGDGFDFVVIDSLSSIPVCPDITKPDAGHYMAAFKNLANETGATFCFLRHRFKADGTGETNVNSGLGSITITANWRWEIGSIKNKKGCKVQNIKGQAQTLHYSLDETDNDYARLCWGENVAKGPDKGAKREDFQEWLVVQLADGPKPAGELIDAASKLFKAGRSWVYDAAFDLVVKEDGCWRLRTAAEVQ